MPFKTMPSNIADNTKPSLPLISSLLTWQLVPFAELSAYQIYNIIQAREQVFVKDQHCVYIDADGVDFEAMHLSAYNNDINSTEDSNNKIMNKNHTAQLLAYCRIISPVNNTNEQPHSITPQSYPRIGRVLVLADYRGYGLARQLMIRAIDYCHIHFPNQPIHISAQTYLVKFYQSLGFICDGVVFEEQGIEHIHMVLANPTISPI